MMNKELARIFEMSVSQRIVLVEEIWDSIAENPEALPLTDSQKKELDKRLDSYYVEPDAGRPWNEVKKSLLSTYEL